MEATKLSFGTKVTFTWLDSSSRHDWVQTKADLPKAVSIKSIGYVAGCTDRELVITNSLCDAPTAVNDPLAVNWGSIEELDAEPGGSQQSL